MRWNKRQWIKCETQDHEKDKSVVKIEVNFFKVLKLAVEKFQQWCF